MSQHLCISWILCKIHVSGFMSQHLYISGSSARSMSPDSCLSIFVSQDPLQDPCLGTLMCGSSPRSVSQHSYLWILYKIDTALQRERLDTHQSRTRLHGCNQNRHRATTRGIQHARTPQRVARALIQHTEVLRGFHGQNQNRHRATARAIRHARTPQMVARPEKRMHHTERQPHSCIKRRQPHNTK